MADLDAPLSAEERIWWEAKCAYEGEAWVRERRNPEVRRLLVRSLRMGDRHCLALKRAVEAAIAAKLALLRSPSVELVEAGAKAICNSARMWCGWIGTDENWTEWRAEALSALAAIAEFIEKEGA